MGLESALEQLVGGSPDAMRIGGSISRGVTTIPEPDEPTDEEIGGDTEETKAEASPYHVKEGNIKVTVPEGWTDEKLVAFFKRVKNTARDKASYKQSIRDEVWNLYHGIQDFSHKADWQSKEALPKVFIMVESVVAFIKTSMIKVRNWYDVVPVNKLNPENRAKAFLVKQLLKYYTAKDNFIDEVVDALKWSFLSELAIIKCWWDETTKYTVDPGFDSLGDMRHIDETDLPPIRQRILRRRQLKVKACDPDKILLDWTGRRKFLIEETTIDFADLEALADEDLVREGLLERLAKGEESGDVESVNTDSKKEVVSAGDETSRVELQLDEYWGDIWDEDGHIIANNAHFILVNEKEVAISPEPIRFYDGDDPYIIAPCIRVPGSVYNKSLIEPIIGVAKMMTELFNLTFDALIATVMNIYTINVDAIENVEDLAKGIGPNTVIQATMDASKVLDVQRVGQVPGEAFTGIEYMKSALEEDTAIAKWLVGLPMTTKRQTKGEIQTLAGAATGFFQSLIQDFERRFLAPLLKKMWWRIVQFQDEFSYPELQQLIGEEAAAMLNNMTPEERYNVINGDYEIIVTGISGLVAKAEELENLLTLLRIIARSPEMMSQIDQGALLKELFELTNIDPQLLIRETPAIPLPMVEQMMANNPAATQTGARLRGTGQPRSSVAMSSQVNPARMAMMQRLMPQGGMEANA
jgi:hypothetical protein